MRFHFLRLFILGILSLSMVLASIFSIGASAIYFTVDTIPLDDYIPSYPQSYASGVVNDGERSFAFVHSATVDLNAIEGFFTFGRPASNGRYNLYGIFVMDNEASSSLGSFTNKSNSLQSASGYQFVSYYDANYYNPNSLGDGDYYSGVLYSYRVCLLLNSTLQLDRLNSTNFQFEYGNITFSSGDNKPVKSIQSSFNASTPLSAFSQEVQDFVNNRFPDRIDLDHSGETTTIHNTSSSNSGGDNPGGDNPGGSTSPDNSSSSVATGSDSTSTTVVTGPDGSAIFPGGDSDYFHGLDDLLSDLDNASSVMESNQNEIASNFGFVQNIFGTMFEQFPPVIVALVICAVIVLIAVKIIGR